MKKFLKKIPMILLAVFIMTFFFSVFFMMGVFGWHTMKLNDEETVIRNAGYWNKKDIGDYSLNTHITGNRLSNKKIVGISGLGIDNYPVGMSFVNDELQSDYLLVYIDRAGYGASDDNKIPQTVENIVEDYRQALNELKIAPPYVLMPHSLGSVYATYWAMTYPDEIEAIIYIDGTTINEAAISNQVINVKIEETIVELGQLGFYRLALDNYIDELPGNYSEDDKMASNALYARNVASMAKLSEIVERDNNIRKTIDVIRQTDTPKLYISSHAAFTTHEEVKQYFDWEYNKAVKVNYTDERADKLISQCEEIRNDNILPFIESIGNAELINLPGDHCIYLEKPIELANIIQEFLSGL